jgi:cell division protein FtsQ
VCQVVFLNVLAPLAIIYGVYLLAINAASSPRFLFRPGQSIRLSGNHVVSRDQVLEALGFSSLESGSQLNLFRLNLAAERQRLDEIPWIKSAAITRIFPNHLAIGIAERTPVAFVNIAGQIQLVDRDGAFLRMPSKASFDFPVLDGLDS